MSTSGEQKRPVDIATMYEQELVRSALDAQSKKFLQKDFLKAQFASFADFLAQGGKTGEPMPWVKNPQSPTNLLDFVKSEAFKEGKYESWIKAPNAETDEQLVTEINGRNPRSNVFLDLGGTLVESGEIHFLQNDTDFEIRLAGRYRYWGPNMRWLTKRRLTEPYLKQGPITIVMIAPGQIGIALDDNKPCVLLPGRHAYNSPLFLFSPEHTFSINEPKVHLHTITILNIKDNQIGIANLDNQYMLLKPGLHLGNNASFSHDVTLDILGPQSTQFSAVVAGNPPDGVNGSSHYKIGTVTISRVRPNEYGCAFVDNEPKLLYPGFYAQNSPSFSFQRTVLSNAEHIIFGTLHVLNIAKGQIALVTDENRPMLVEGPGVVMKNSTLFQFHEMKSALEKKIVHGSITRYRIPTGNIGFARRKGIVEKLSPGVRVVDDPDFVFLKDVPASTEIIQEGHYSLITSPEGGVRPVWVNGVLEVLHEGFKQYETPNIIVGEMIALSPPIIEFKEIEAYTRDRSQMLISGQVEYEVQNPKQLVTTIGAEALVESLEKRVDAILRHSLAITDLSSISPEPERPEDPEMMELRGGVKKDEEAKGGDGISMYQPKKTEGEDPSSDFTDQLSKEATKELSTDAERWGVKVIKVEVSDIHYKDEKVELAISERTTQTRIAESDYDLTLVKNRQEIVETEAKAQQEYILTESKTKQALLEKRTAATNEDIENEIMLAKKKTAIAAETMEVKGRAEAEAAVVVEAATAEARAIEIRADAKLLATKKEAEGKRRLVEVEHKRYGGASKLLELELMALEVEMAEAAAHAKVPTVSMNTSSASEGSLLAMLRNQGTGLFRMATAAAQDARQAERESKAK